MHRLSDGFDTLVPSIALLNKEHKKLLSARRNPSDVQDLIEKECLKGYLYGPFEKPLLTTLE